MHINSQDHLFMTQHPEKRRPNSPTSRRKHPLRIAQIAPIVERVPPKKYGGTERVCHALVEELVLRGHHVTLFASGDSITSAKLVSVYPRSLREAKISDIYGLNAFTLMNIGIGYSRESEFDVIHDHNGQLSLPTAQMARTPVVMTMHGPIMPSIKKMFEIFNKPHVVTISNAQAHGSGSMNHAGTIYNGLDMGYYPFSPRSDGYLLFVGRISMEKGTHIAIEVAQYLDLPLIIAAKLDTVDLQYFKEYIEPKLSDDRIRWIGEVDEETRNRLMSKAICLLHPATWREPFGLTLIEAMTCGAPVVAFRKGSIPEIVRHGKTGFIVESSEEMAEAVENIKLIRRADCRRHALENFNASRMADMYERLYYKILEKRKR